MAFRIVLIDYENDQPTAGWDLLARHECVVRVFLGANQKSTPVEMAGALQPLGKAVEYVRCEHTGKNALDFLLAFHLGQLAVAYRNARFWIVSKDRGFDSLVKHLCGMGISCARTVTVTEIFAAQKVTQDSEDRIQKAIDHLNRPNARPRTLKSLNSAMRNLFKDLDEPAVEALIATLRANRIFSDVDGKITYSPQPVQVREPDSGLSG